MAGGGGGFGSVLVRAYRAVLAQSTKGMTTVAGIVSSAPAAVIANTAVGTLSERPGASALVAVDKGDRTRRPDDRSIRHMTGRNPPVGACRPRNPEGTRRLVEQTRHGSPIPPTSAPRRQLRGVRCGMPGGLYEPSATPGAQQRPTDRQLTWLHVPEQRALVVLC